MNLMKTTALYIFGHIFKKGERSFRWGRKCSKDPESHLEMRMFGVIVLTSQTPGCHVVGPFQLYV